MADYSPRFMQVANGWFLGVKTGNGPAIASQDSFYLLTHTTVSFDVPGGIMGTGLVGVIVFGAMDKSMSGSGQFTFLSYADLPENVRNHPDWSAKPKKETKVVVIPFSEVQSVKMPWWGALTIVFNGLKFKIPAYSLKRKPIRAFLEQGGLKFT